MMWGVVIDDVDCYVVSLLGGWGESIVFVVVIVMYVEDVLFVGFFGYQNIDFWIVCECLDELYFVKIFSLESLMFQVY